MIRQGISRLHIANISKPSLVGGKMATAPRYTTATRASAECSTIRLGDDVSPSETSCSSFEDGRKILTLVNSHDAALIDAMSFKVLGDESGDVGDHSRIPSMEALEPIYDSSCRSSSVHSDTTRRCDHESQTEKGRRQDADLSSSIGAVFTAAAALIRRVDNPLYTTEAKYRCATETCGCTEVRVGQGDHISRWLKGSILTYTVDAESFPTIAEAMQVKAAMQEAISMWEGIGARFKYLEVDNNDSATFVITYRCRGPRDIYASSFFPDQSPGELLVYNLALSNATYLANILAHEVGHIVGLRHEFADKYHNEGRILPCVLLGKKNPRSVMNYYEDPGQLQVSEQDLRGLKELYECNDGSYEGLPIYDYDPISRERVSREEAPCSHAMRKSGRKFSCRSALRNLGSFIFAAFHDAKRATV